MALDAAYRAFVAAQPHATVWHRAELIEALADADARVTTDYVSVEESGRRVAVWPLCIKRRTDGRVVTMPPLLRYAAPLVDETWRREVGTVQAMTRLFEVLPKGLRSFDQSWPADIDAGPLLTLGWHGTTRKTHLAPLDGDKQDLTRQRSKQMAYDLRRAARELRSETTYVLDAESEAVLAAPYARQEVTMPYAVHALRALFAALGPRREIACLRAHDSADRLQAVAIVLRDVRTGYALLTGSTDAGRAWSGGSFALAAGMAWAQGQGCRTFDFLGSDTPGIADTFRRLGGEATPYTHVHRDFVWWARAWRGRRG